MKIDEILTWAGSDQFPWNHITFKLKIDEILAWADPDQFP